MSEDARSVSLAGTRAQHDSTGSEHARSLARSPQIRCQERAEGRMYAELLHFQRAASSPAK
jgi:hypothetical protein